MCNKALRDQFFSLEYISDWFVTQQQVKIWHDDDEYHDDDDDDDDNDRLINWYDGYQRCKAQKAQIKEEPLPIACHRSHWRDWCMSKDEKKQAEKLWK